jgi:ATP synthase protein I
MFLKKLFSIADPAYMNALSHAGSIGLHMVSGIAVGAVLGYFLDKWLGTQPWLTAFFLLAGIAAGFKNVYVDTKRLAASQDKEAANAGEKKRSHDAPHPPEH